MNNLYHDLVLKIFYSEATEKLHSTRSPIRGFPSAADAMLVVKSLASYAAIHNHLDPDYCELLAMLYFYDMEELRSTIKSLSGFLSTETDPRVAHCAAQVIEAVGRIKALPPEELEARGGWAIAVTAAVDEIQ